MSRKTLALVGFAIRWSLFMVLSIPPVCFIWYPLAWAFYILSYQRDSDYPASHQKFSKAEPFFRYGLLVAEQNISFPYVRSTGTEAILQTKAHHLLEKVVRDVPHTTSRLTESRTRSVTIADVGIPTKAYEKTFIEYSAETTLKTRVSVLFGVSAVDDQVSVRWWILMRSQVNLWKAVVAGLIAPFTVLYWGSKQFQGVYSVRAALASELEHDYDLLDVEPWLSSFQTHLFSTLLKEMAAAGFDVETYNTRAPNFNQPLFMGENTSLQIGTRINTIAPMLGSQPIPVRESAQIFIDATQPSREAFIKRLNAEAASAEPAPEATETSLSSNAADDTVEVPQVLIEQASETEDIATSHLGELQRMLRYHVESQPIEAHHQARAAINELIVELETGDEISIKVLTDLLGELRTVLGDTALRDTLEMLTDPTSDFNIIVQEVTGDMLANLGDEITLKVRKRELNETLIEYANKLEVLKRPLARVAIFSLMHTLDNEIGDYTPVFKEIHRHLGSEAYELMLHTLEAEENLFPATAQAQAKRTLEILLKKQDLREVLVSRTSRLELPKQEQAIEAIDRLIAALEDNEMTDYKALFREVGLRLGRTGYEAMLRKLATDENYFPVAQSDAKRDLDIYERAQQRSIN